MFLGPFLFWLVFDLDETLSKVFVLAGLWWWYIWWRIVQELWEKLGSVFNSNNSFQIYLPKYNKEYKITYLPRTTVILWKPKQRIINPCRNQNDFYNLFDLLMLYYILFENNKT